MSETVKLIFSLSISGGLFALVLFTLKPFMRNRLSKSFQYYIWIVVLLRFIVPFSFGINLMDYITGEPSPSQETVSSDNPAIPVNPSTEFQEREYTIPYTPENNVPKGTFMVIDPFKILAENLLWIWLSGTLISAAWNILGYLRFIRYVCGVAYSVEMPDCGVKVYKSRFSPTPMLVGVFKPRIYLPDIEYSNEQLQNILLHELTHLRRRDVWLKWFSALVVSIHWFNPIAYFMRREFNRACELSCDEAVIRNLDGTAKQSYGHTLISVVAESRYPVGVMSVTMCEEKKKLKERLVAIMNYKKKTKIGVLITAVLSVVITGSAFAFGAGIASNDKTDSDIFAQIADGLSGGATDGEIDVIFQHLQEINTDIYGWIKVSGTVVDYPVVQTTDNDYYLKHDFYKTKQTRGAIFADFRNSRNVEKNLNTVIYGHNLNDNTMFGTLLNFDGNADAFNGGVIELFTQDAVYRYAVFSVYETYVDSRGAKYSYITTDFNSDEEYIEFLTELRAKSDFNKDIELSAESRIITLSTCTNNWHNTRFAVHGVLIEVIK